MMGKKREIKIVCRKCGNEPPRDIETSEKTNWKVFDTSRPCEKCGEKQWIPKF